MRMPQATDTYCVMRLELAAGEQASYNVSSSCRKGGQRLTNFDIKFLQYITTFLAIFRRFPKIYFRSESKMGWDFIGVYIINRTLHGHLEIRKLSSRVEKYLIRSLRSLVAHSSTPQRNFVSQLRAAM